MMTTLQLLSGADIPYPEAGVLVHQPTIKEIGMIGQQAFFGGCQVWRFTKENLPVQDRMNLSSVSNFDIIMSILGDKHAQSKQTKTNALFTLSLFFPTYTVSLNQQGILLERQQEKKIINASNFDGLKQLLGEITILNNKQSETYKAAGDYAQQIAEKLMRGRQKVNQLKKNGPKPSVLSRYASILSVGTGISLNEIMKYTIFQLMDAFKRFELKQNNDLYIQQKLAGAKNVKAGQSWLKDFYEKTNDDDFIAFAKKHHH